MMLFDAVQSRGALFQDKKFVVKWVLLLLGTIFFRNNGLYIVIGIFVLLLFAYRKQAKRVLNPLRDYRRAYHRRSGL